MSMAEKDYLGFLSQLGSKSVDITDSYFSCTITKSALFIHGAELSALSFSKVNISKETYGRFMYFLKFVEGHNPRQMVMFKEPDDRLLIPLASVGYASNDDVVYKITSSRI